MGSQNRDRGLGFVLGWLVVLLIGWNTFAQRFDESASTLRTTGVVFDRAARNLGTTLAQLPPPALPRVAIFGSSQIAVVKRDGEDSLASMPHRLAAALEARGHRAEIVDLSDGGQQLIESLLVHYATRDVVRPDAVVVGVSLFAMHDIDVRATLFEHADGNAVASAIRAALPADADPETVRALLRWTRDLAPPEPARDLTIQERFDRAIGGWLDQHVAAYANRRALYRDLVDGPLRRAVERRQRARAGQTLATSYSIGRAYAPSLLALDLMRRSAAERGIPFVVVALPFDHGRPPVPFDPATQARVVADLGAIATRALQPLLDLGDLLPSDRFGDYEDGSPDTLHFDATGHEAVAERIAERLAPLLGEAR